ncbi:MAG: FHA domain-containing protein [Gemmatimonadetes bacterium]|nr:FHA domain-containing protein [Gemmatimonadota bacterium]
MGPTLILEVTDHRGRVRFRGRLNPLGASIGRGYGNDVILDDPYLDPVHLRIAPGPDGELAWRDAGSANGTWDPRHQRRLTGGAVVPGLELKVGRSVIRFVAPDQAVAPALRDPAGGHGAAVLLDARRAGAALAAAMAIAGAAAYFTSTEPTSAAELAKPGLATLLLAGLWATGWAFTNRIVAQRFRFLAHWAWTALVATAFLVIGLGFEWLGFLWPGLEIQALEGMAWALLGTWLLVGHFQLITEWPAQRRWVVAGAVTVTLTVVIGVLGRDNGNRESLLDPTGSLKPLASRFVPTTSMDGFFTETAELKRTLDEEADPAGEAEPE